MWWQSSIPALAGLLAVSGLAAVPVVWARQEAAAQTPPPPLLQHTFEQDEETWMPLGDNAKLSIARMEGQAKQGKGALQFTYSIKKGEFNALLLPVMGDTLKKAQSFRFWVWADHATPLVLALQERGSGRYLNVFSVPARTWQQVILSPSDFVLSEDANDPKDSNNKLDLDQIEGIGLIDFGQFFAQAEGEMIAKLFSIKTGEHTMLLDNFVVSEEPVSSPSSAEGEVSLDAFARPQVGWLATGGVALSSSPGKPLDGRGMQAAYRTGREALSGLLKRIPRGALAGKSRLAFDVAAEKAARLVVQLEEVGGGKYNTIVEVPADKTVKKVTVAFDLFQAADDSKDSNNKLDLEKVNQIVVIDATGLLDGTEQANTLWIGSLRAVPAK